MNELCKLFMNIKDGDTLVLEANKTYHVRQDDSFELEGYYCSNTAKKHENPTGLRRTAMFLLNKNNITVDGNGATVIVHGKMTPMLFDKCNNITVKNLTIDYACPTMAELTVLSNNNGICDVRINADCLFKIENNELIWLGENGLNGKPYWKDSYRGNRRHVKRYDPITETHNDFGRIALEMKKIEQLDETTLRIHLKDKSVHLPAGSVLQTRNIVRDQTGSLFQRCKNLVFDSLRVKFMHGLGMVSQFCENVTYTNCNFFPKEGRTIASTADFFQFSGCKGNLIIENCKAQGAHDDYINVHGTHLQIVKKNNRKKSIVVRFMHAESWGFQAFDTGDEINFIKWDTLIPYATAKVISFVRLNDTDIRLFLDRNLPDIVLKKDVVENATWTPNLYVRNNYFGKTSGRGILATTRGEVIIENNTFYRLWGPALLIEDDCNFWFESGYTKEIIFRNNRVCGCDYGATFEGAPVIRYTPKVMDEKSEEFVHGKLILTDNVFEKSHFGTHSIHLKYLESAVIENNAFDDEYSISVFHVGNITDKNNRVIN